jgi:hypothetical protein
MDFDTRVKLAVYEWFAATGSSPTVQDVAARVSAPDADVRQAYARLRANRVLFLEPDGETIRMASPFSGVETQHQVVVDGKAYFANCAWDCLGVVAALRRPGVVYSECAQSRTPLRLEVGMNGPEPSEWLFHSLVPAAEWWKDLVFT